MTRKKKFKYPDNLDEEKVMKKWREAIELVPSLINSVFKNGQVKVMTYRELLGRLKEMDIDHDDAEDIIYEAERKKLLHYYSKARSYRWIPERKREEEINKTERLERAIEDILIKRNVKWLSREELIKELIDKEFSGEDIERAIREAVRDCVIDLHESEDMLRLVPEKERTRMWELKRLERLDLKKRLYGKMMVKHA
ncbi:MAG: hypothetical protein FGF51_00285 [Candidatus Brockarchaeota archaeon]|nr:hypothetical protein [Candidatus Brockarchaeota archaeon]